jgi:hypothetical protein
MPLAPIEKSQKVIKTEKKSDGGPTEEHWSNFLKQPLT